MKTVPGLVAHRGNMAEYPENTLAAIRSALDAGADGVEFDLQMTARGDFVLLHDDNFMRTAGIDRSVFSDSTQMPSVHEPSRFGLRFQPEYPPMLSEVIEVMSAYPDVTAFAEIKAESLEHWGVPRVMSALAEQLDARSVNTVVISYSAEALRYLLQRSDLETGWVLKTFDTVHRSRAESFNPQYLICNTRKIDAGLWEGPWRWMLYDVMEYAEAQAWHEQGAALIETGAIARLADARRAYGEHRAT